MQILKGDFAGAKYNVGFAFNRATWTVIKKKANFFCNYDDYHWDWTMSHLAARSSQLKGKMLAVTATRVYHMGEW